MFRGLRLRLTLLYVAVALALVGFIGGGTYVLINSYLQRTVDLALQTKLVQEMAGRGLPIPSDLALASQQWDAAQQRGGLPPRTDRNRLRPPHQDDGESYENGIGNGRGDEEHAEDAYNFDLAAIFVLPVSADGQLLTGPGPAGAPFAPNQDAITVALRQGSDLRTIHSQDGSRIRLLTYRISIDDAPGVLQLGRVLRDQERVLTQLLTVLLGLGGFGTIVLGGGSWWLAGRSLRPAQQAWEQQLSFIANASHELRTPLTLMRASTEVALRETASGDQRELLGDVIAEADHMSGLVDDLLLLARLDAGRLKGASQDIVLADLLVDVRRQVGRLADERGVCLRVGQGNGVVRGDPQRLRQVLLIVLDNALRHTPAGGAVRIETQEHKEHVALSVVDTGEGIPPEHLPHVFERFYRADSARSDENGGTGLGLSIAKALVQMQHGQISITSRVGQGTSVTIMMPRGHA